MPGEQAVHSVAPLEAAKRPLKQASHKDAPADAAWKPASQAVQFSDRIGAALPALHALQFTDSSFARFPALQAVQLVAATASPVALPAEHAMQSPVTAEGAYFPAVQYSQLDPLNTKVPLGQAVHSARSAELNFPAPQSSQSSAVSCSAASRA